jgi:hypothetical protein
MTDLSGIALKSTLDIDAVRAHLKAMSDAELLAFGKQMHELVYPLSHGPDGKSVVCAFSIQLEEARKELKSRRKYGSPKTRGPLPR